MYQTDHRDDVAGQMCRRPIKDKQVPQIMFGLCFARPFHVTARPAAACAKRQAESRHRTETYQLALLKIAVVSKDTKQVDNFVHDRANKRPRTGPTG